MEENLIKRFATSIKCSVCGRRYAVDNVKVLGHQEDLWFLSVFCSSCDTRCLVAAVIREGKAATFTTDLTEAELDKFSTMDKVTADEVLDMHSFLKDFDGSFNRLFNQK